MRIPSKLILAGATRSEAYGSGGTTIPIFCYFGWLVWAPNTQFWGLYRHSKNTRRHRVLREARYTPKHPETTFTLAVVVRLVEVRSRVARSNTRPRNVHNQSAPWVGPQARPASNTKITPRPMALSAPQTYLKTNLHLNGLP